MPRIIFFRFESRESFPPSSELQTAHLPSLCSIVRSPSSSSPPLLLLLPLLLLHLILLLFLSSSSSLISSLVSFSPSLLRLSERYLSLLLPRSSLSSHFVSRLILFPQPLLSPCADLTHFPFSVIHTRFAFLTHWMLRDLPSSSASTPSPPPSPTPKKQCVSILHHLRQRQVYGIAPRRWYQKAPRRLHISMPKLVRLLPGGLQRVYLGFT